MHKPFLQSILHNLPSQCHENHDKFLVYLSLLLLRTGFYLSIIRVCFLSNTHYLFHTTLSKARCYLCFILKFGYVRPVSCYDTGKGVC